MTRLLTALATFTALTTIAHSADLPRRAAPPVFTPVPVFTWTGFYAGFNAGYGVNVSDERTTTVVYGAGTNAVVLPNFGNPSVDGTVNYNNRTNDGFTGGGQIGYNYQFTPGSGVVVGVEADAQYVDFGGNRRSTGRPIGSIGGVPTASVLPDPLGVAAFAPDFRPVNPNGVSSLDYFGTVRGRIGYAFDRVLFYGTGGFAYGSGNNNDGFSSARGDDFRTGYTVGGGVEYALPTDSFLNFFRASAVTFKVEGLYVNLDRTRGSNIVGVYTGTGQTLSANDPNVTVTGLNNRRQDEFAVVRAGINYKFGSY